MKNKDRPEGGGLYHAVKLKRPPVPARGLQTMLHHQKLRAHVKIIPKIKKIAVDDDVRLFHDF
jgi:hypothetical protein